MRLAYSAYGAAYKINTSGALEPLSVADSELVVYGFQGRQMGGKFFIALNLVKLEVMGTYTSGPCINGYCEVTIKITWILRDTYDWQPGEKAVILSSPISGEQVSVEDKWAAMLEDAGMAKSFKITSTWRETRKIKKPCCEEKQ